MMARNLVVDRASTLTLMECHQLDQLAYQGDTPIICDDLQEAMQVAVMTAKPDTVVRLAAQLHRAFAESQCHDHHRPGAMTTAWAAALACSTWGSVSPDVAHELTWRWQRVTGQKIHDLIADLQERMGVPLSFERRRIAEQLAELDAELGVMA